MTLNLGSLQNIINVLMKLVTHLFYEGVANKTNEYAVDGHSDEGVDETGPST